MKKFLALALALTMAMSMVTVGAGATFTDDADIQQKEAVALLAGLGIIEGPGDGSFNPKGTITRGAAAKIITWMLEGKEKSDAIKDAGVEKPPFSDVPVTSSNAAFIAYCAEKGIVSGRSDGTFRRADGLTGNAFLKMVLIALGVKDIDFNTASNPGWPIDAVARADQMGLLKNVDEDYVYSSLLSRENACQIAYNALVEYTPEGNGYILKAAADTKVTAVKLLDKKTYASLTEAMAEVAIVAKDAVYGVDYTLDKDTSDTLGAKVYGIEKVTGTVEANAAVDSTLKAAETVVEGKTYNFASGLELIGHEVTVYFNNKPAKEENKNVYAVHDNSKTLSVTTSTTLKTINAALDAKKDTDAVAYAANFTTWSETYADTVVGSAGVELIAAGTAGNKAAFPCTLIITDNAVTGLVYPTEKTLDQVTEIENQEDEKTITLKGFGELKNGYEESDGTVTDVVAAYDGIAEDDYVVVTLTGDVYTLEKAKVVTGKPTKVDGSTITINGIEYAKYTKNANHTSLKDAAATLTAEITLYLDSTNRWLVKTSDKAAALADIVYVADVYEVEVEATKGTTDEFGQTVGATNKYYTYFAQVVTLDGETTIYPITTDEYSSIRNAADALYKVTLEKGTDTKQCISGTGDVAKYVEAKFADFTKAADAEDTLFIAGETTLSADLKATDIKLGSDYFSENVSFIWVYGDKDKIKVAAKNGVQALDKNTKIEFVYSIDQESKAKVIEYVIVEADPDDRIEYTGDVIYVLQDDTSNKQVAVYTDKNGDEQIAYEHEVYVNGVKTKVVLDTNRVTAGFKKMTAVVEGVYKLETLKEGVVENKAVTGMYKGLITIDGVTAQDIDVTGVRVADVRTGVATKITDATKITTEHTVSVVLSKAVTSTSNSIVTIYIVG